jgi:hypothetical protein
MALDETHHRLFIGCRQPARVLILDTRDGRVAGSVDVVGDTDDLFYDERRKRVYVTGGAGFIDVLQQGDPDHLERTARLPTRDGARTSLFVAELDHLYVACPRRNGKDAEIRVYAARD